MLLLTMIQDEKILTNLSVANDFVGHIIWPVTLLLIFLLFRKQIVKKMEKLNSIQASSTGVSLHFGQELDEMVEEAVENQKPKIASKSGVKIGEEKEAEPKSPVASLLDVRDEMNQKIVKKADSVGIATSGKSSIQLLDELESNKEISSDVQKRWSRLINLTNSVDQSITKSQVNKVKLLFNNYSKEL